MLILEFLMDLLVLHFLLSIFLQYFVILFIQNISDYGSHIFGNYVKAEIGCMTAVNGAFRRVCSEESCSVEEMNIIIACFPAPFKFSGVNFRKVLTFLNVI